jgi:hypothetical protein
MAKATATRTSQAIQVKLQIVEEVDAELYAVVSRLPAKMRAHFLYTLIARGQVTKLAALDDSMRDAILSLAATTEAAARTAIGTLETVQAIATDISRTGTASPENHATPAGSLSQSGTAKRSGKTDSSAIASAKARGSGIASLVEMSNSVSASIEENAKR